MSLWPIWVLACLALCGCHTAGGRAAPMSEEPCPSPNPCDDPDPEARLSLPPAPGPMVTVVDWQPLWPGCPTTLQVMARLRPIVFQAVRPDAEPETDPDPSDWVCDPPEDPLLRAGRDRERQHFVQLGDPPASRGN